MAQWGDANTRAGSFTSGPELRYIPISITKMVPNTYKKKQIKKFELELHQYQSFEGQVTRIIKNKIYFKITRLGSISIANSW